MRWLLRYCRKAGGRIPAPRFAAAADGLLPGGSGSGNRAPLGISTAMGNNPSRSICNKAAPRSATSRTPVTTSPERRRALMKLSHRSIDSICRLSLILTRRPWKVASESLSAEIGGDWLLASVQDLPMLEDKNEKHHCCLMVGWRSCRRRAERRARTYGRDCRRHGVGLRAGHSGPHQGAAIPRADFPITDFGAKGGRHDRLHGGDRRPSRPATRRAADGWWSREACSSPARCICWAT